MRKKVSMKDIAKEVGVSTALVSYVLNGKLEDRINPETAEKIRTYAKSVGYFPNQIAQSLRSDKTFTIGLVIADISNLYYSNIARIIEDESQKHNYNVIFGSADENLSKFKKLVQVFLSRQVDGLILAAPAGAGDYLNELNDQGIPFVLIDRYFPTISQANSIIIDNFKASYEVARLLHHSGFRRPALITLRSDLFHMQDRTRGFMKGFSELVNEQAPVLVEISEEHLANDLESLLMDVVKNKKIDAVYFATNRVAMVGLNVFVKHQIKVPQDLGVVCFDEAEAYKLFSSSITYVKQPLLQIGREAVEMVVSHINGKSPKDALVFDTNIILGESSRSHPYKSNKK